MKDGRIEHDFYDPKVLSSTYIVRAMHTLYNEEREKDGLSPVYYKMAANMLQAIIDTEPECVKLLDGNSGLIMMNPAGLSMIEAESLDQVRGQCILPLVVPEYREALQELTKRVFNGESGTLLFEMVGMKGRHLWLNTKDTVSAG